MGIAEARDKISTARGQLERVQGAASDLYPDPENAVMWAFYAYENCVVAIVELHGRSWSPNHYQKARLARNLYADGLVSRDIGDELEKLNVLRKDVAYNVPGPELQELNLEDLSHELEMFIDEIESGIESLT